MNQSKQHLNYHFYNIRLMFFPFPPKRLRILYLLICRDLQVLN